MSPCSVHQESLKAGNVVAADKRQSYALAMPATVNEDGGGGSSSSIASFRWHRHWVAAKEADGATADMTTRNLVLFNKGLHWSVPHHTPTRWYVELLYRILNSHAMAPHPRPLHQSILHPLHPCLTLITSTPNDTSFRRCSAHRLLLCCCCSFPFRQDGNGVELLPPSGTLTTGRGHRSQENISASLSHH